MSEEMNEDDFTSTIKLNYRTLSVLCHSDKTVNYPPAEKELAVIKYRYITTAKVRRHVDDIQRFYSFPLTLF
jgi:curved DNA-binding protein CbpA